MKPAHPGAFTNAAGKILYNRGVIENWTNANGRFHATFIGVNGNRIELPGVQVSPLYSMKDRGFTIPRDGGNGLIYLDSGNGIEDIEHEYGQYLDYQSRGGIYYNLIVVPYSLINAGISALHQYSWPEIRADRLAIQFFGPNSAIASSKYYPH